MAAAEALTAMGRLAKSPVSNEDRLLVCENAASSLLSLASQIALEVSSTQAPLWAHRGPLWEEAFGKYSDPCRCSGVAGTILPGI